jgi:hypothetical protein
LAGEDWKVQSCIRMAFLLAIVAIICYVRADMLKSQETLKSSCALLFYSMDKKHLKDSRFCMN